jgi:Eukaryotic aspartyl protease
MMEPSDFLTQNLGDGYCVGALAGIDVPDDSGQEFVWILGALFLKNVITVFDLGAPGVGFGRPQTVGKQYGSYTVIPLQQGTQLGTGPDASLMPTWQPTTPGKLII